MHEREWNDRALQPREEITLDNCSIRLRAFDHQLLVSGDIDNACSELAPQALEAGFADTIGDGDAAIRLSRDRALLITRQDLAIAPGWYPVGGGYAISMASGLFSVFELTGASAPSVLVQGTTIDLSATSRSAALLFRGESAFLVRQHDAWLLGIDSAAVTAISTFFRQVTVIG